MDYNEILKEKNLSPMMKQYLNTKLSYVDCLLFYRIGDFYELFYDDANIASKELEIALTSKDCGLNEKAPMCGVPFHSANFYINKLVDNGHKVAIAEQVEDPKFAKGIVKREVIKTITPGTCLSDDTRTLNNYIFSIFYDVLGYSISIVDFSTGEFYVVNFKKEKNVIDIIDRFRPKEILFNPIILMSNIDIEDLKNKFGFIYTICEQENYDKKIIDKYLHLKKLINTIDNVLIKESNNCLMSIVSIYKYIIDMQKIEPVQFEKIINLSFDETMYLDVFTIRNLELIETMRNKEKYGSLLYVLDKTKTSMGLRLLKNWILEPLNDKNEIIIRQDAIKELIKNQIDISEINKILTQVYDIERLFTKMAIFSCNPRDLISFKNSIVVLPYIFKIIEKYQSEFFSDIKKEYDDLSDLSNPIKEAILDEPQILIRNGGIIKDGYNGDVDKYRESKLKGKEWVAKLEETEKNKTGIKNLKIKHSRMFGYLFEITNIYKGEIPDYFIRKQTLSNAERYTTKELDELQNVILNADERLSQIEYDLFMDVVKKIVSQSSRIKKVASIIAKIDAINSLANVSLKNHYVCPLINDEGIIDIKNGRHPVIEVIGSDDFVSNDTILTNENHIDIITGPNMAGKSTYMRQVAIITLMAHMGCFIPADSANITLVDRIYTRVGASDDLTRGQSTFLVEMSEMANIIDNATNKSLVILDEIGRGTSTYDGLSIAWTIVEYISEHLKSKTLFATHYHELSELEGKVKGVVNYHVAVLEENGEIVFLRKIIRGFAKKSYGIAVAKLAGINNKIIKRSNIILNELIKNDVSNNDKTNLFLSIDDDLTNETGIDKQEILKTKQDTIGIVEENVEETVGAKLCEPESIEHHRGELSSSTQNENFEKYKNLFEKIKNLNIENLTPINAFMMLMSLKEEIDDENKK